MNKIFKVIWSKVRNCYVAVSEIAKRNGKSCTSVNCGAKVNRGHVGVAHSAAVGATLLAGVCSVLLPVRVALAAPVMPTLDVGGKSAAVTIASTSSATSATMNISSTQGKNVLKWIDFSIGQGGTVNFTDTNHYLNYVTGHGRSEIYGTLTGKTGSNIYLVNPNGILIGNGAVVNVGNLYLSTHDLVKSGNLTDYDTAVGALFQNGNTAAGDVINLGTLNANTLEVEGNNITFKNVANVVPKDNATVNVNLRAGGEVHVGYAPYDQKATSVNPTQYTDDDTTKKTIDYSKWNSFSVENNVKRLDGVAIGTNKYTEYMLVRNASELQNMQNNLTGNYMLANDIDFNDDSNFTNGFKPIGYKDNTTTLGVRHSFSGKFDGVNYEIKNLKITDDSLSNTTLSLDVKEHVGLFGDNTGTIENVGVVDTDINVTKKVVGGIVGYNNGGTVRNVYHTGSVKSDHEQVGGIAGANTGVIEKAYNTGSVDGNVNIGGIVGLNNNGKISEAYNASNVGGNSTPYNNRGGIVGYTTGTSSGVYGVYNTYNEGSITGNSHVGGIVGRIDAYAKIESSYNTGAITQDGVNGGGGGIVGYAQQSTYVYFSTPAFFREGTGTNTYGGTSKTVTELKQSGTFSGWDISATGGAKTTWRISEGQTTPQLTAFLKTKDYIDKRPYDGTADFGEYKNVGTYKNVDSNSKPVTTHQVDGLSQGFDYVQDVSVIEPRVLTASFDAISKTYDGTTNDVDAEGAVIASRTGTLSNVVQGEENKVSVTGVATYADENASDSNITVSYGNLALVAGTAGDGTSNYMLSDASVTGNGTINKRVLTASFDAISKTYDGTTNDVDAEGAVIASRTGTLSNVVEGEENKVSVTGVATYTDENASDSNITVSYGNLALVAGTAGDGTSNYMLSDASVTGNGTIAARLVTLSGTINKVYDRTNTATPTVDALSNVIAADKAALTISATSATFSDVNVGNDLTVTYEGLQLGGTKAGNYSLSDTGATVLNNSITQRDVTLTGTISKVYDGTTAAIPSAGSLSDVIGEDLEDLDLLATSASFDNKNVGENNRTITYEGLTLSGEKAPNYRLTNTSATIDGNTIIPKELALVADKVRIKKGGTPPTTFTGNLTGFVPGEELNPADRSKLSFTASISDTTTAGSYPITGTFNGQKSGTYRINDSEPYNYTFKNAISNATAFTIFTDMLPKLDLRGGNIKAASPYVTIDDTTANTMVISSTQEYNVLKWIDFSIDSGGTVKYDAKNYLNFVTGHGRSEVYGTLTGDGNIYLINPNGILFGSDAQVDVGNLYLSTRNLTEEQLADYTKGVAALYKNDNAAVGDIINIGRLDADLIKAEGRNISFKNIADVTTGGTLTDGVITGGTAHNEAADGSVTLTVNNVEADPDHNVKENKGEIHLGFAVSNTPADRVNSTQYTNVTAPTLAGWTANVTPTMYMLVRNEYELQNMNNNLTKENAVYMPGNYMLANDIDASLFKFMPVGSVNGGSPISIGVFKGKFDGLYHVIKDITIDATSVRSDTFTDIGVIGSNAGTVENLGVVNGTVDATGINNNSAIGGIVGANKAGAIIRNVYFSGSVKGYRAVGGIAGWQNGATTLNNINYPGGIIENAYSTGTVSGNSVVRGIVGEAMGIIRNAYGKETNNGRYSVYAYNSATPVDQVSASSSNLKERVFFANKGWDISSDGTGSATWRIYEGQTMPLLTAFLRTKALVTETEYNGNNEHSFDKTLAEGDNHIIAVDTSDFTAKGTNAGVYQEETKKFYSDQQGYNIVDTELVIQPKRLTLVNSKTYDGTTNTNTNSTTDLAGIIGNDAVTLVDGKVTGIYADKNVGENKSVIYTTIADDALDGTSAVNYILTAKGIGTISPRGISVAFGAIRKTYDGLTTSDTIGARTFTNVIAADAEKVDVTATATYDKKDVGDRSVAYTGVTLTGDEAGNYSIADTGTGAGTITPRGISVAFGAISKTYDGLTTSDTIGARTFTNVIAADAEKVDVTATATYDEKNAGNRTVDYAAIALTGDEANNYSLTHTTASSTGTINKRETGVSFGAISKTYDGLTTSDTIGARTFTNVIAADADKVDVTATATYDKKNAGNRTVDYSAIALTGVEANNYSLTNTTASSTGTIDKKLVTATFADISKIYDGTTNTAPGAGTLTGVIAADEGKVNVSASAAYDEKNAGSRTVNYTGVTLSGAEAGNYSIATTATGNGTIGRKALELVADPASTEYGDYNPASFTGRVDGFVTGESVSNGDTLLFALSDPSASAVGSYGITGTINGSSSGDYGLNYTFTNAASNANAFTIYARPASVQDMVLSDIIPGIKGKSGADISVTALDNAMEQARDKRAEVGIEFAIAQTILSVDADRNLSLENRGMKQPPAMTPQEVAEQVHAQQGKGNGVAAQAGGNAGAASGGTNENGAASNAGVTGAVNAAMDVVQQTDDAVGTEESKRKKGVA